MGCTRQIKRLQTTELLGRIVGANGLPIVPGDIAALTYSVFIQERATGEENEVAGFQNLSLTPVTDFIETSLLLNDQKWKEDRKGYNVHFFVDGSAFAERGEQYLVRLTLSPSDGVSPELIGVWILDVV